MEPKAFFLPGAGAGKKYKEPEPRKNGSAQQQYHLSNFLAAFTLHCPANLAVPYGAVPYGSLQYKNAFLNSFF